MIRGYVEVSQESMALAEAEAVSVAETLGGHASHPGSTIPRLIGVEVPDSGTWAALAGRLGLARRCLVEVAPSPDGVSAARAEGHRGGSAAFRRIGAPSGGGADATILACGRAFKEGGGTIDLDAPRRRYWVAAARDGTPMLLEEVASVDRSSPALRTMPLLPFRRPVSLPPKFARAAVNLARVRAKDRILDPFLGTGALVAEAGLVGARLFGVDRDPAMVRGALQNLSYLGVTAEELLVGDSRDVGFSDPTATFSAIVTDPPYGRASSTGGDDSGKLVAEVVERWCGALAPGGRLVLIVPTGGPELPALGAPRFRIPVRVHRSLTREFRLYEGSSVTRRS